MQIAFFRETDFNYDNQAKASLSCKLGYIPVVGSLVGFGRVLNGLIKVIISLAKGIFQGRMHPIKESLKGFRQIARGMVEMTSVAGLGLYLYDRYRLNKINEGRSNLDAEFMM